jgi:hypothetical protein
MKGNIILFLMIGVSTLVHIRILRLFHYQSRMTITWTEDGGTYPGLEDFVKGGKQQQHQQQQSSLPNINISSINNGADEIGDTNDIDLISVSPRPRRKWAYAFLMAGVDAKVPSYKGIFYNILVTAEILKESKADIVVMVQMSRRSKASTLTEEEESYLRAMNVKIHYLDVPKEQNFYQIQFEKFRILNFFTEYSRVIYMDGDVMPYCNIDYMFELSEPENESTKAPLKENVVIAWSQEPSHGGFFMLQPKKGDFDLVQSIIHRREKEAAETGQLFDRKRGWGHVITPPDRVSAFCVYRTRDGRFHNVSFMI